METPITWILALMTLEGGCHYKQQFTRRMCRKLISISQLRVPAAARLTPHFSGSFTCLFKGIQTYSPCGSFVLPVAWNNPIFSVSFNFDRLFFVPYSLYPSIFFTEGGNKHNFTRKTLSSWCFHASPSFFVFSFVIWYTSALMVVSQCTTVY